MDLKSFVKKILVVAVVIIVLLLVNRVMLRPDDVRYCETRIIQVQDFPLSHLSDWEVEMCLELNVDIPSDVHEE